MNVTVIVNLQVEGFHCWPKAPVHVDYLRHRHRHMFHIEAEKVVEHTDRDVEIITLKNGIQQWLHNEYGGEFGTMSCEDIAKAILVKYDLGKCTVLEDGENGGRVYR